MIKLVFSEKDAVLVEAFKKYIGDCKNVEFNEEMILFESIPKGESCKKCSKKFSEG